MIILSILTPFPLWLIKQVQYLTPPFINTNLTKSTVNRLATVHLKSLSEFLRINHKLTTHGTLEDQRSFPNFAFDTNIQ
jgi:hypothetical protein